MKWLNVFGLIFMVVIMIPNVFFAAKCNDGFKNTWKNRIVEILEQIGRFGCFVFMIINIPGTWFGFFSDVAFTLYLIINPVLLFCYSFIWIVCFKKNTLFKALALSIIPSAIFLFSGIISRSILLTISAIIFAPCHITISFKNAIATKK